MATSISAALSVALLYWIAQEFDLQSFAHRAIGGAVVSGQDAGKRAEVFFNLLGLTFFVFALVFSLLTLLLHKIKQSNLIVKTRVERTTITQVALLSYPCLILEALHVNSWSGLKLLGGIAVLAFFMIFLKIISFQKGKIRIVRTLSRYTDLCIMFLAASGGVYALTAYFEHYQLQLFGTHSYLLFFLSIVVLLLRSKKTNNKFSLKQIALLSLFVVMPIFHPLACEIHFWITKYTTCYQFLIYWAIILSFAIAGWTWINSRTKLSTPKSVVVNFCFPMILLTSIIFICWQAEYILNIRDLLHPGNFIVPAKQFIRDGAFPFLDFWPDLGLQATIPSSLYILLFGNQELDGIIWSFIPRIIGGLSLYYLLKQIFPAQWVLLLLLLFPFVTPSEWIYHEKAYWFPNRITYSLVIALAACNFVNPLRKIDIFLFWALCFLCIAWLPSTGKAVLFTALTVMLFRLIPCDWKERYLIFISSSIILLGIFVLYCILLSVTGHDIREQLASIASLGLAEKYVLSYPQIIRGDISGLAVWYYAVIPVLLVSVLLIFFSI